MGKENQLSLQCEQIVEETFKHAVVACKKSDERKLQ
jgi:hypothetical protein